MHYIQWFWDFFVHLDVHLGEICKQYGGWTYGILFAIIFAETGLVITPFLPGDSLLFAAGALAASTGTLSPLWLFVLLTIAAVVGDGVNYAVGAVLGPKVMTDRHKKWLKREHLEKTHAFYEKYGAKMIILARFVPIVRTFAPFVAGVGTMSYFKFAVYNVVGGIAWVAGFIFAGYFFGNLPTVKRNFHLVILAIIVISWMPLAVEYWKAKRQGSHR
ncbi:MAG TPA: DedA family protein [Phycisphaerae bacterium]|nr:DedA family protein [Phycisphaerae bacterium]